MKQDAAPKLCKDCKWRTNTLEWKWLRVIMFLSRSVQYDYVKHGRCSHPFAKPYRPDDGYEIVTGKSKGTTSPLCVTERRAGSCGATGRLWERR